MEKNKETKFTQEKEPSAQTETIFEDAASANECTGLMQGMPIDEADKENYGQVFDYGPEAASDEVNAGEVKEPHEKRGMAFGDPAGTGRE